MTFNRSFYTFYLILTLLFLTRLQSVEYQGLFYQICDTQGVEKGFLLGSVHLMEEENFELSKPIKESYENSKCLIVELDTNKHDKDITFKMLTNRKLMNFAIILGKLYIEEMGLFQGVEVV